MKSELAESVRNLLTVAKPIRGFRLSVDLAGNGDDTMTIKATLTRTGSAVIVR